mmetsp:Transcript_44685/g.50443  ORF Transcript_44685/g.50443 Transcript_44685/m.50443 type:complete len:195 (-) Transcript_44685:98-682(-)
MPSSSSLLVALFLTLTTIILLSSNCYSVRAFTSPPMHHAVRRSLASASRTSTGIQIRRTMASKPGIASLEELTTFVNKAGSYLVVIDVRNPDATKEPGDQKSLAVAPLPISTTNSNGVEGVGRSSALHLIWDREAASMPLPPATISKNAPIITHCGGGGRGQKAKDYLESKGYTNVVNGAGPKETELWKIYGEK